MEEPARRPQPGSLPGAAGIPSRRSRLTVSTGGGARWPSSQPDGPAEAAFLGCNCLFQITAARGR